MKKIFCALLILLCAASASFAAFGKRGEIPNAEGVVYRGLAVTADGVNVTIANKNASPVSFCAALVFLDGKRKEAGDVYIARTVIEANGAASFKNLYLKGDYKACKSAASLRWTIYEFEEAK